MLTRAALFLFCLAAIQLHAATTFEIKPDKADGVYQLGETINWSVKVLVDKAPAQGSISYTLKNGGLEPAGTGSAALADGSTKVQGKRDTPGTLTLEVKFKGADGKETGALGGAVVAPEKIAASMPPPDDFDAFWKAKIEELNAVPMNAQLTPVNIGSKDVEYSKITMDNIRGSKIQGQLAKPVGKTGLPAMLQVQYAGVYGLQKDWVTGPAKNGWLMMNISAHDLPIDEKPEFYKDLSAGALKNYTGIGKEDREKSYFLRMFLSCYRAVEYLKSHPDWDKKTIVVVGGSQGGYQAIVTAGMHPSVTAFAANVPAGCDHTGRAANRLPGWPNWGMNKGAENAKDVEVGRYFDAMNFATRAKCPGLIGVGLVDSVCPPEGIFATFNQLQGEKKMVIMPESGHGGEGPGHRAYYGVYGGFLEAQRKK